MDSPGSVDTSMLRGVIELESRRTDPIRDSQEGARGRAGFFQRWADPAEVAEPIYLPATGAEWLADCDCLER